jgi:hypothetical protein
MCNAFVPIHRRGKNLRVAWLARKVIEKKRAFGDRAAAKKTHACNTLIIFRDKIFFYFHPHFPVFQSSSPGKRPN